jgi:hypothetical protein
MDPSLALMQSTASRPATPRIVQFARSLMARHGPNEKRKHYQTSERKSSRISRRRMKVMKKTNPRTPGFISFTDQADVDDLCLDSCPPCHVIKDRHCFAELQPFHRKFSVANSTPWRRHQQDSGGPSQTCCYFQHVLLSESHPESYKHGANF